MKRKLIFGLFLILVLSACGGGQAVPTEEPAVAYEEAIASPNFHWLNVPTPAYFCVDTWADYNKSENSGFVTLDEKLTDDTQEGVPSFRQTWRISLYSIQINDRIVTVDNWTVIQEVVHPDGNTTYVQELNPNIWVERAKELAENKPNLMVNISGNWDGEGWDVNGECYVEGTPR